MTKNWIAHVDIDLGLTTCERRHSLFPCMWACSCVCEVVTMCGRVWSEWSWYQSLRFLRCDWSVIFNFFFLWSSFKDLMVLLPMIVQRGYIGLVVGFAFYPIWYAAYSKLHVFNPTGPKNCPSSNHISNQKLRFRSSVAHGKGVRHPTTIFKRNFFYYPF